MDAGSWFHVDFKDEKIPSLNLLLDYLLPRSGLLIELKNPPLYPGIEQKVADELIKRKLHQQEPPLIMVQSFDAESVQKFHSLLPSIPAGMLLKRSLNGISKNKLREFSSFAQFVNPRQTMMTASLTKRIHAYGMNVFTWTVNKQKQMRKMEMMNVDGIATDFPDLFIQKTNPPDL